MSDPIVLLLGDCLERMRELDAESVDAIVTDPPAGIGFMGKAWDHHKGGRDAWVAWLAEVMAEALRVAKPGAHALVWALPRTSHWTAWALEEAGWEVRDRLAHVFASGFPKSLNLPGGWGTALKPAVEDWWLARKPLRGTVARNVQEYGTGALNIDGTRIAWRDPLDAAAAAAAAAAQRASGDQNAGRTAYGRFENGPASLDPYLDGLNRGRWLANLLLSDPELFDEPNPGVVGSGATVSSGKMLPTAVANKRTVFGQDAGDGYTTIETYGDTGGYSRFFAIPRRYNDSCELCGAPRAASSSSSGSPATTESTAPQPANSPPSEFRDRPASSAESQSDSSAIGSALSPALTGASSGSDTTTDSQTTSETGSGFWNDADPTTQPTPRSKRRVTSPASGRPSRSAKSPDAASPETGTTTTTVGPWTCATCAALTTSLTTSESPELADYPTAFLIPKASRSDREPLLGGLPEGDVHPPGWADGRQWDIPGSHSKKRANVHPTVKPLDLMRHLVRLVTPPGGLVLDPFLGSGTTAIACQEEGFRCIGIEKEPEYMAISEARLNGRQVGLGLDVDAPRRKRGKANGHWPKERGKGGDGYGYTGQGGLEERYEGDVA